MGGIETMLVNIANNQISSGNRIVIIAINDIVDESLFARLNSNVEFHCLKRNVGSKSPIPLLKLNKLLANINPDVIHLHYASISRFIFLKKLRRKLCVTLHDMCTQSNSRNLPTSGPIFAISKSVQEDIRRHVHLDSTVVLNGIDTDAIRSRNDHNRGNMFEIVQVSRLHPKKGQDILIKAIGKLRSEGIKNIRLTLIGDGETKQELDKLVSDLKLNDQVVFLGKQTQEYVFENLHKYDLFVQPSRFEGFGLTVTEAMAAKIPLLVSDNQGPMEIIEFGKFGYYFKGEDVDDCARQIKQIMEKPTDEALIQNAWNHVIKNFSVKSTASNYLRLYQEQVIDRQQNT